MNLQPHEGYFIFRNEKGGNGYAEGFMVPHEEEASILVAQNLFQPHPQYPDADHYRTYFLGFVMGKSLSKAIEALDTGRFDRGNAKAPCLLTFLYTLRTSNMMDKLMESAVLREIDTIIALSDGSPAIKKICQVLKDDCGFIEQTNEHTKRPLLIKRVD